MADGAPAAVLDTSGMRCPLPVLKARKAMAGLESGQVLRVLATDPASAGDFDHFCQTTGHILLESGQTGDTLVYLIRKTG